MVATTAATVECGKVWSPQRLMTSRSPKAMAPRRGKIRSRRRQARPPRSCWDNRIVPATMQAAPTRRLPDGRSPRNTTARRIAEKGPMGMMADERAAPIRSMPT